jgi:hypothetical protein
MKTFWQFSFLGAFFIFILSCSSDPAETIGSIDLSEYNNTKGYWENGKIITRFNCPDAKGLFPPIDIRSWNKIAVVNGRLPKYQETKTGLSIHHYGEKEGPNIKHFKMILPRLAYCNNPSAKKGEMVIVIQIVQTSMDTIVGYRYLTGGCGGSLYSDFRFLTDEEVEKVTKQ